MRSERLTFKVLTATFVVCCILLPKAGALMLRYDVLDIDLDKPGVQVYQESTVTVNIRGDVDGESFAIGNVKIVGSFSNVVPGAVNSGFDGGLPLPGTLQDGSQSNVWLTLIHGGIDVHPPIVKVSPSEVFSTFTLTAGAAGGTITIDDIVGNMYYGGMNHKTTYNTTEINMEPLMMEIVPEPATLAILGLGGLILRRRQ